MHQGTQLHLALLRKISQLMPTANFRQRFNQSRKRRDPFRCNMTEQSQQIDPNQTPLPLFQLHNNQAVVQNSSKKSRSKKLFKQENITISAWSIDEKDQTQIADESRYGEKFKQISKNQPSEPRKKRNFSLHGNFSMKKALPQLEYIRSPSQDYASKMKMEKDPPIRCRFNKLKHINLNLDKQNQLNALQHFLLRETKIRSVEKISSYNAFVAEMKQQERNKKLRT